MRRTDGVLAFALVALLVSCGGSDSTIDPSGGANGTGGSTASAGSDGGASSGNTSGSTINCTAVGMTCQSGAECCSGSCDPAAHVCLSNIGNPAGGGAPCTAATDCASLSCMGGVCTGTMCASDGQACTANEACCSGVCDAGSCKPLNTSCKTAGNSCANNSDCCSQLCQNGSCVLGSSFCIQTGDLCARDEDCCGHLCSKGTGAAVGVCTVPAGGATFCGGEVDGTVCNDCGGCCSRLCAPYGPTGVNICQPANGCHIDGDLCVKDSDCCGAAGTGLPGDGNVHCEIADGQPVGICRNPTGCNPEGNVCHYKENEQYQCQSVSMARNDCCAAPGNSGVCQLDPLGVPRCYGFGGDCRHGGDICAFSGDCCNNVPCVPGDDGQRHCLDVPDGGPVCVPSGGKCTINGDCCPGSICIESLGSSEGVCGEPQPPSTTGGGGTTGATTGTTDGGTTGGTTGATDTTGSSGGTSTTGGTCALYGQICQTSSDCCGVVPCTGGICRISVQ